IRGQLRGGGGGDLPHPGRFDRPGGGRPAHHLAGGTGGVRGRSMKRTVIGWREWVALPRFGVTIKAKVDTGAASASLHAFNLERFTGDGTEMVRFDIHPRQRSAKGATTVEAEVVDERQVRNPGGRAETRPVIRTRLRWAEVVWETEINLTRRDE